MGGFMNILIDPISLTQLVFILMTLPIFIWAYTRSKFEAVIFIVLFILSVFYSDLTLSRAILDLFSFVRIDEYLYKTAGIIDTELIKSDLTIEAWFSYFLAFVTTWSVFVILLFNCSRNKISRGTSIKTKEEMRSHLHKKGKAKIPVKIGRFIIPQKLETRPIGLYGEPGSGKTQVLLRILKDLALRVDRAVVVDINGEIFEKIGKKGDLILSVTHEGVINFSVIAEVQKLTDCEMLASAFIPTGNGESETWNTYARTVFSIFIRWCWEHDRTQNRHLIHFIKRAPIEELERLCRGSSAQRLFEKGSEKMLSNVMSILSQHLTCLELLNPAADKNSFSIRKWITSELTTNQKLWIIYDEFSSKATLPLRTAWIEILTREVLNLRPDASRRLWLILDELASNGKIGSLSQAVSRGRKYGLVPVMAVQSISQLYSIYGRDEATSIMGSIGHAVVLRTPDPETSDYLSRSIGDKEIQREQSSYSKNGNSTQKIIETKRAVLPSEISSLIDLNGYIKFAGVGWTKIKIPILKLQNKNSLFPKIDYQLLLDEIDENESHTNNQSFDEV
jgi:type IV secretory pathway TraG/TraD family ATPase VirD4